MRTFYRLLISYLLINIFHFTSYSQQPEFNNNYLVTKSGCKIFCKGCSGFTATWNGKCLNGFASGYGKRIVYYSDGAQFSIYDGNLVSGKRHGQGTNIWPAKKQYKFTGIFKNGDMFEGKSYYEDGELYSTFSNGVEKLSRIAQLEIQLEIQKKESEKKPCKVTLICFNDDDSFYGPGAIFSVENYMGTKTASLTFRTMNGIVTPGKTFQIGCTDRNWDTEVTTIFPRGNEPTLYFERNKRYSTKEDMREYANSILTMEWNVTNGCPNGVIFQN